MASEFPGATPAQPGRVSFPSLGARWPCCLILAERGLPGGLVPAPLDGALWVPARPRPAPIVPGSHGCPQVSYSVPNSFSFCFFHQSQISGSHQAILCHLAGNSEAREKGKFPRWSKKPCKTGRWEFTVQLKMASAHRMETAPLECSCVCWDTHGSR